MKKYTRKLLPYIIAIIVIIGLGANQVNAATIQDEVLDRVAEKIANTILGDMEQKSVVDETQNTDEQQLGFTSSAPLVTDNNAWMKGTSRAIYFGATNATYGIRDNAGTMQYKNSSGSWSSLGGTTPGNEGWVADASDIKMYPANSASGDLYPVILGEQATSSPADVNTELYVGGSGGFVVEGTTDIGGSFQASSTGEFTDNLIGYADFTVYSGARVGTGSTGTHITALANDSLFVEGESEFDGATYIDGALWASSTLAVTGNTQIVGTLTVVGATSLTGNLTTVNASSTNLTAATYFNVGGANGLALTDGSILDVSGAISFGDETLSGTGNWTTTGNITGVAGTFSGNLTIDTNTLYVYASGNTVGIGTTTPTEALTVYDGMLIFDATSPYDKLVELVDSDDDGVINIYANNSITNVFHGNGTSYITGGTLAIGTTTSVAELSIMEATNPQLQLGYDATNFATWTVGSGGDLVVAASGGDISFSNENLVTTGTLGVGTTTISANLTVDTNTLIVDATNNRVGIASTTPGFTFSVGTNLTSTTTSDFSKACLRMTNEAGVQYWCRVNAAGSFTCTTASCQ